MIDLLETLGH